MSVHGDDYCPKCGCSKDICCGVKEREWQFMFLNNLLARLSGYRCGEHIKLKKMILKERKSLLRRKNQAGKIE